MLIKTIAVSLVALTLASPAAFAAEATHHVRGETTNSMTVRYGDLNISSTQGAKVLLNRIKVAADQVCGHYPTGNLSRAAMYDKCFKEAVAQAVSNFHNPVLTAVADGEAKPVT